MYVMYERIITVFTSCQQDVEAASSRAGTSAYEEALRRGIALVKERKAASLLDAAKRAGGLSIFDLTEKLAREVT